MRADCQALILRIQKHSFDRLPRPFHKQIAQRMHGCAPCRSSEAEPRFLVRGGCSRPLVVEDLQPLLSKLWKTSMFGWNRSAGCLAHASFSVAETGFFSLDNATTIVLVVHGDTTVPLPPSAPYMASAQIKSSLQKACRPVSNEP